MKKCLLLFVLVVCTVPFAAIPQEAPVPAPAEPAKPVLRQWVEVEGMPTGFLLAEYHEDTDTWSWQNMLYHRVKMPASKDGLKTVNVYVAINTLPEQAGLPESIGRPTPTEPKTGVFSAPAPKSAAKSTPISEAASNPLSEFPPRMNAKSASPVKSAQPGNAPLGRITWDAVKQSYVDVNGDPVEITKGK